MLGPNSIFSARVAMSVLVATISFLIVPQSIAEAQSSEEPEAVATFGGVIGRTQADSQPQLLRETQPRPDSPNVIYIVLDDAGFADLGCYGSQVETPNIDGLAARGLLFNNFHSKSVCSPTRASLLTGRNAHAVGMKELPGGDQGFPNSRGRIPASAANVAQLLSRHGYSTFATGKWHLVPRKDMTAAGDRTHWPLRKGFDRFHGFLSGWTDQYQPDLVIDNHATTTPNHPDYHFSEDIVDQSVEMLGASLDAAPEKPFFLYLAFGAVHAPIQVPSEYINKYRGKFDAGWDAVRRQRYRRQIELGVIPSDARLPERNPGDPAWDELTDVQRRVFARFMEAYAGFLDHTDVQIGRLVDFLKRRDQFDNTLIVLISDNGGAPEAGVQGNFAHPYADRMSVTDMHERLDDLGSRDSQPLYQRGWAMASNAPFKYYKLWPFNGGVRTSLIVSWPRGIRQPGLREQFVDVIDITPTVLDVVGVQLPERFDGARQIPLHGKSFRSTLVDADAPAPRTTQYFELWGSRSIYHEGWKAIAFHTPGTDFEDDGWRLYDLHSDFTESNDLSSAMPQKLAELKALWWIEAERHDALPLLEARGIRRRSYDQILSPADSR